MNDNASRDYLNNALTEHFEVMEALRPQLGQVSEAAKTLIHALKSGKRVYLCGNGGSAADAQHIAAEIIGRFEVERDSFPAIALTTDTSILTAVANDYGFEQVFARQIAGLGSKGDVLMAYSTSGNSANVLKAAKKAKQMGLKVIGLTGQSGGALKNYCDNLLVAPSSNTARIQEVHGFMGHLLCGLIDKALVDSTRLQN